MHESGQLGQAWPERIINPGCGTQGNPDKSNWKQRGTPTIIVLRLNIRASGHNTLLGEDRLLPNESHLREVAEEGAADAALRSDDSHGRLVVAAVLRREGHRLRGLVVRVQRFTAHY